MRRAAADFLLDRPHVTLRFGRAVEAPEYAGEKIRLQGRLRPVHPALPLRACGGILAPERALAVARREVAQDRVGFPHRRLAVDNHGHAAVRVHGAERGCVEPAEGAAQFNMTVREAQLAHEPHDLLHVERTLAAVDGEHDQIVGWAKRAERSAARVPTICLTVTRWARPLRLRYAALAHPTNLHQFPSKNRTMAKLNSSGSCRKAKWLALGRIRRPACGMVAAMYSVCSRLIASS